jgi:hypothetical protein
MACLVVDISRLERPQELPVASFGVVTPSISDWSRSTSGSTERSISASQSPYDSNGILGKTRFTGRPPNYGTRSTRTVELLLVLPVLARRPADKRWTGVEDYDPTQPCGSEYKFRLPAFSQPEDFRGWPVTSRATGRKQEQNARKDGSSALQGRE